MCRWIAYRGENIALKHYVTSPSHSLIAQSLHALESTASTNGDGFGLGWYGDHAEPGHETGPVQLGPTRAAVARANRNGRVIVEPLASHLPAPQEQLFATANRPRPPEN
jgi:hypothetical protein